MDAKEESYEEGVESGIEQNQIDTVRRMLENGFDTSTIQKIVNIPIEKINEIIDNLKE